MLYGLRFQSYFSVQPTFQKTKLKGQFFVTTETSIDTSILLTTLAISAAVWAVVPANTRLRFRLSMTGPDLFVIFSIFLIVHYIAFAEALSTLGLYYSFGPWKWGLDNNSAIYLTLLSLGIYLLIRTRAPKLAKQNISIFRDLAENLLLTKRFDELFLLIEPQLSKLLTLTNYSHPLSRLATKLTPVPVFDISSLLRGEPPKKDNKIRHYYKLSLNWINSFLSERDQTSTIAKEILQSIVNSPPLVSYLAVSYPHFCLKFLEHPEIVRDDFLNLFMDALLDDKNSKIYVELKNNQNLNGRHRLSLPKTNRILFFFFKDVSVAAKLGLYQAIGEAVCRRIDEDQRMAEKYNQTLGYYCDVGKNYCQVHAGIKLFEIMIHEGIHQFKQDHLWLFYFTHFGSKIISAMRDIEPDDENHEFPTPFYYLLYQIISITSNWTADGLNIKKNDLPEKNKEQDELDHLYISKQAVDALGTIIQDIIQSPKIAWRFKKYSLSIALKRYKTISHNKFSGQLEMEFINSIILGKHIKTKNEYRKKLSRLFNALDHRLKSDVPNFANKLKESLD